jgi:uncharacterized protein
MTDSCAGSRTGAREPLVWVLRSDALGGDGQSIAVAEALGWPYQTRHVVFKSRQKGLAKYKGRFFGPSLAGVNISKSDKLEPPWPDLIVAAGRRQVPVEFWIRAQNHGRTRLVHLQRPLAPARMFDLVICDAYQQGKNVVSPKFPLMRKARPSDEYLARWRDRFKDLPRPWVSLLIGGPARPFIMPPELAATLMREVGGTVSASSGTLLISTSRRTPKEFTELLLKSRPTGSFLFEWSGQARDNPYSAMVHLSDRVVVTSDSVSMAMEAVRANKPTEIYMLPEERSFLSRVNPIRLLYKSHTQNGASLASRLAEGLRALGLIEMPDHLKVFVHKLVLRGSASYFGHSPSREPVPLPDEVAQIAETIKKWFQA